MSQKDNVVNWNLREEELRNAVITLSRLLDPSKEYPMESKKAASKEVMRVLSEIEKEQE